MLVLLSAASRWLANSMRYVATIGSSLPCPPLHAPLFPAVWELFCSQRIMDSDEGLSIGQMFYMIAYKDWRPEIPPNCPPGYVELMTSCWQEDPEQRPTAQQLLKRLQKLQGQARQESPASLTAHTATQPAGQTLYAHSTPSGSREAGQQECCAMFRAGTCSADSGASCEPQGSTEPVLTGQMHHASVA
jgi:hypothetical protein